eukprot:4957830-Pleurochrysis_carterae.AAC.1
MFQFGDIANTRGHALPKSETATRRAASSTFNSRLISTQNQVLAKPRAVYEFIQHRIARRHNSHAIQTPAMAARGGVPVLRLAVGVRSHLAAAIADLAYT